MNAFKRIHFTILVLILGGCTDGVGAKYFNYRIIKNSSDYPLKLKLYLEQDFIDTLINIGDSVLFSAYCENINGHCDCVSSGYNSAFAKAREDSVKVIFNNERIIRFIESEIGSCCSKNILVMEPQWGYKVSGKGTFVRTYTFEITNEDYEIAKPYSDGD